MPASARAGHELVEEQPAPGGPGACSTRSRISPSCWPAVRPSGVGVVMPAGDLVLQPGDPDLEELVEVLAEDGQELGPLEQRDAGRRSARASTRVVEVEPGQLAVQEADQTRCRPTAGTDRYGVGSGRCQEADGPREACRPRPRRVAEVPVEQEVLALGVADDPLAVAAELRVVGRQQHQAGHDPGPEVVDQLAGRRSRSGPPSAARPGRGTRPSRAPRGGSVSSEGSTTFDIGFRLPGNLRHAFREPKQVARRRRG